MKRLLTALLLAPLCGAFLLGPAQAQKTKAQLTTEVGTTFPDNTSGQITPSGVRAFQNDMINSIMPTAPVGNNNFASFDGTTGLLKDSGISSSSQFVANANIIPGAANTVKGSLDGATTSDIALVSCSVAYRFTQWVSGTGWRCGISPVLPARSNISSLDLSAFTAITVQGFATAGDGGGMTMLKSASQPFCANSTNTTAVQDSAGNWFSISENSYNIRQFGAKQDGSTDDTTAIQSALDCAAMYTVAGGAAVVVGVNGRTVYLPPGISMASNTLTVPNGVVVIGSGPISSVWQMTTGFPTNKHFVILGPQFQQNDIALVQSSGGAGNLTLNGARTRSGVNYNPSSLGPEICSGDNNNTTTFTFHGINAATGLADTDAILGPAAGNCVTSTKGWLSITQISTSAGYTNVTAGYPQVATFGSRLENMQLFSSNTNATQFTTFINNSYAGTTGVSGNAMVYTNSAQHTGGLSNVKMITGNRSGSIFESGIGGASVFTYDDVEINFSGNCGGCASNNPGAYFNYGGLLTPIRRVVLQGASSAGSVAMNIAGGHVHIQDSHVEGVPTGFDINSTSVNSGIISISNCFGGSGVTDFIKIEAGAAANITYVSALLSNGSTNIMNNKGALTVGNIVDWTKF
jgi:hypothetical protein